MYRVEDIEVIEKNVKKIQENAMAKYRKEYEPNLEEISKVYQVITKFIQDTGRVVYGGFAQNLLIKAKNPDDIFYKELNGAYYNWPDIADIEFYSPTPAKDIIDLTEELYKHGFKHIEGKEGQHEGTYKVFVNFENYCDITYIPAHIHNTMPIIKVDGLKCTNPHFMLIDTYRVITDPSTSYWRLEKSICRFQKIIKYYPIEKNNNPIKITHEQENKQVNDFIRKNILRYSKFKLIVVGFYAYNYYVKKADKSQMLNFIPYYEAITTNLKEEAQKILDILKKQYGNKIKTKEYHPFFQFIDSKIEYYYEGKLVLRLFGNNERCIVYHKSSKKGLLFGTYSLVLMYLFFNYIHAYINKEKPNTDLYYNLIGKFFYSRNKYLDLHKLTVIDESPFQDFTLKCLGFPVNQKRESLLTGLSRIKSGKKLRFRYGPSGKPGKVPEFMFPNNSGNEILNEKNLILKN